MRDRDSRPAVKERFANRRDRPRVINVGPKIRAVIDPAQNPFRFRNQMKQAEAGAIGRRAVNRKPILAARLDPHPFVPGDGVANSRLRRGGRDHDWFPEGARCGDERPESRRINTVIVGE
jgi:hypothetical protein